MSGEVKDAKGRSIRLASVGDRGMGGEPKITRLGIIKFHEFAYVGKLIYQTDYVDLVDVVEFVIKYAQTGQIIFLGFKLGKMVESPEEAFLFELNDDSPFYVEYLKVMANIQKPESGLILPPPPGAA